MVIKHSLAHRGTDINFAREHAPNRVEDGIERFALHHVAARARPQRALGIEHFIVHRDDQHRQFGLLGFDHFCEFDPIGPAPEAHVHDREIKFLPPDRVERREAAVGFRADFNVGLLAEELNHALAKKRVIIDEQNATSFRSGSRLGF